MYIRQMMRLAESSLKMSITVLPLNPSEMHNLSQTAINFVNGKLYLTCKNPENLVQIELETWVLCFELSISISLI